MHTPTKTRHRALQQEESSDYHRFLIKDFTKAKASIVITIVMTVAGQKNHYNVKPLTDHKIILTGTYGKILLRFSSSSCEEAQ